MLLSMSMFLDLLTGVLHSTVLYMLETVTAEKWFVISSGKCVLYWRQCNINLFHMLHHWFVSYIDQLICRRHTRALVISFMHCLQRLNWWSRCEWLSNELKYIKQNMNTGKSATFPFAHTSCCCNTGRIRGISGRFHGATLWYGVMLALRSFGKKSWKWTYIQNRKYYSHGTKMILWSDTLDQGWWGTSTEEHGGSSVQGIARFPCKKQASHYRNSTSKFNQGEWILLEQACLFRASMAVPSLNWKSNEWTGAVVFTAFSWAWEIQKSGGFWIKA